MRSFEDRQKFDRLIYLQRREEALTKKEALELQMLEHWWQESQRKLRKA